MNETEVRRLLQDALDVVAPGADVGAVRADADLRKALDLDSLDFMNLVVEIDSRLGTHTDEIDYPRLTTIASCGAFLQAP